MASAPLAPGHLPNPLQAAGWLLESTQWAAPAPLLIDALRGRAQAPLGGQELIAGADGAELAERLGAETLPGLRQRLIQRHGR